MRIIVNHLTRMQSGYICVAGINTSNNQHVRPVLRNGRLTTDLLTANGGPFALASLVDLGPTQFSGNPPEVEDHLFNPYKVQIINTLSSEQFWKALHTVAQRSILEIFGPAIQPFKRGCVVDKGTGNASLGCLLPAESPHLSIDNYGKIRMQVTDGDFTVNLSVTDIHLYETDQQTPKADLIRQLDAQMRRGDPVILSIGLARAWQQPGDTAERHWLQVNNIHLKR
jgi:putative nucleic acid modification protein with dual OB domain